jgi:mannose-6-phosphate isomerase-like protein (cupin superfamily)
MADAAAIEQPSLSAYKTAAVPAPKGRTHFKLRAPLLDEGRSNTHMGKTDNMWATLKVYASGGENTLHAHPREDHMFVIMQGSARFYDDKGAAIEVVRHEGVMLPAGTYYYFYATSEEPLVLLRVGCRATQGDASGRLNIRGEDMPGDSQENKAGPVRIRPGAFFE